MNVAAILEHLYPGITIGPGMDCNVEKIGDVVSVVHWSRPEPQPTQAEIEAAALPVSKAQRITEINTECRARLLSRFGDPAEQVSRAIGVYGLAEKSALETGIAATIDASNTASDAVTAATTIAEVEAVTVAWPAI